MLYLISISIRNAIPKRRILFRTAFTMRRPSYGCGWRFVADVVAPDAKVTPDDDRAMAVVDDPLRLCWAPPELQRSVVGSWSQFEPDSVRSESAPARLMELLELRPTCCCGFADTTPFEDILKDGNPQYQISELAIRTEDLDELVGFALANHHPRYQTQQLHINPPTCSCRQVV